MQIRSPDERIGLTESEYIRLDSKANKYGFERLKCEPGQPPVFEPQSLWPPYYVSRSEEFPKTTVQASEYLRARGYDCQPEMLEYLVESNLISLSEPNSWSRENVEAAADYLENAEIFTPYAMMCHTLGLSYADFLNALLDAAHSAIVKYRCRVPASDKFFVMHRTPRKNEPARVSFTLRDDIEIRLKHGKEICYGFED